jgi:hypothetical protein
MVARMTQRLLPLSTLVPVLLAAALCACQTVPQRKAEAAACGASITDLAWIEGRWFGTISEGDVDEHWMGPAGDSMIGMSRTVSQGRTVFFEYLRIEARPDGLYYVAHPKAREGAAFKLVSCRDGEALFENPQHDFPRRISYRREPDGRLVARIEGEEGGRALAQDFVYRPR